MQTESLCPICMKKIPAYYESRDGKVYLRKSCPEHGQYKVLTWSDEVQYLQWAEQAVHSTCGKHVLPVQKGCPYDCGMCSEHQCGICTAVIEITYQCNMDCKICFADTKKERYHPDIPKIREMYETAWHYGGDCSIQLSGGEPTVREDLPEIIRIGKEMGFSHIQINTNGIRIAESLEYLQTLKDAGADLIYLQFDGTTDEIYQTIRGRSLWKIKQQAVENCGKAGIGVMLVPVIVKKVNDWNIGDIVTFAKNHMPTVKGIHFQPVSYFGRYPDQVPPDEERSNLSDVIQALAEQTRGEIREKHIMPRKPYDAHCSFSGLYYLGEDGRLQAISNNEAVSEADEHTDFAAQTNKYTNEHWRIKEALPPKKGSKTLSFLERLQNYMLSISGMGFQDIWNIDLKRLRGCCVFVISADQKAVPLCAFHITSVTGERLYRNEE